MKVVFIYPETTAYTHWKGTFHFGLASIMATLRKNGYEASLTHIKMKIDREEFLSRLAHKSPFDLIGIAATTNTFKYATLLAEWAKSKFDVPIVLGGSHARVDPNGAIQNPNIDIVCTGEGEMSMLELCRSIETKKPLNKVGGIWFKDREGNIIKNDPPGLIEDLDSIPYPDRESFDYENLEEMDERRLVMMAMRGCPYQCTYCCNHIFMEKAENRKYIRYRSVNNIIDEIKLNLHRYPRIERIMFHDDILMLNKEWFNKLMDAYEKHMKLPFMLNTRANLISKKELLKAKKAGCVQVSIGIESGNDYIRNKILGRNLHRHQILEAFRICHDVGLRTYSFNMVGIPGEDSSKILDTIKLNAHASPSYIQTSIFFPYPGTKIYKECEKNGCISDREVDDYFKDTMLNLVHIGHAKINFFHRYFNFLVGLYKGLYQLPYPVRKYLVSITDKILSFRFLPHYLLVKISYIVQPKLLFRESFPTLYKLLRPIYKRYQYRYK